MGVMGIKVEATVSLPCLSFSPSSFPPTVPCQELAPWHLRTARTSSIAAAFAELPAGVAAAEDVTVGAEENDVEVGG